jgi:hypothetical protein
MIAAASLVLCIGAVELLPRTLNSLRKLRPLPRTYAGEYQNRPNRVLIADAVTGWRMRPHARFEGREQEFTNHYATNAQGFRANFDFDPGEKRKKIALTGDSFTFGVGVELEETYGARMDSKLEGSVVYNFAMPGFGLDQMWLSGRHQALPMKPDLVIVSFISESFPRSLEAYRITEGWNKPAFKLVGGSLIAKTAADRPDPLTHFLDRYSVIWRAGVLASRVVGQRWPHGESWRLNGAILRQIQTDMGEQGVPVLFVLIPTYYWRSFPAVTAYMKELGADFVDLGAAPGLDMKAMYYPGDGHLNAAGHRWAAEVLLDRIRRKYPQL